MLKLYATCLRQLTCFRIAFYPIPSLDSNAGIFSALQASALLLLCLLGFKIGTHGIAWFGAGRSVTRKFVRSQLHTWEFGALSRLQVYLSSLSSLPPLPSSRWSCTLNLAVSHHISLLLPAPRRFAVPIQTPVVFFLFITMQSTSYHLPSCSNSGFRSPLWPPSYHTDTPQNIQQPAAATSPHSDSR